MWTVLHKGVAGPARGCYGMAEHRQVGNKGSCQQDMGGFVKTSQNDRVRRKGRLDRLAEQLAED